MICLLYGAGGITVSALVSYSVVSFQNSGGCGNCADVYESDLGGNPGTVYVWRKTAKKQDGDDFDLSVGAVFVANLIGGGDIKLDGIGILAGVINGVGVALQILLPKYLQKTMRGIHCWCMDFSGQLLY